MKTDWKVGDKFRVGQDTDVHTVSKVNDGYVNYLNGGSEWFCWHEGMIEELSDDIEVTPTGGKHTRLDERTDLLPHRAILELSANPLPQGEAKYGRDNWRKIDQRGHLNHAIVHVFKYLIDGKREDLRNAACRLLFAMETE